MFFLDELYEKQNLKKKKKISFSNNFFELYEIYPQK